MLLNRAVIGTGGVVAAQALVAEDTVVPPGSMARGVPARANPLPSGTQTGWIGYVVSHYTASAKHTKAPARSSSAVTSHGTATPCTSSASESARSLPWWYPTATG